MDRQAAIERKNTMYRQAAIEQHQKNVAWANQQIRICLMARRLLKKYEQKDFGWLINNASEHNRPELLPLKEAINNESWRLRFQNHDLALIAVIFNAHLFVYEARLLKWKQEEQPWLAETPTC